MIDGRLRGEGTGWVDLRSARGLAGEDVGEEGAVSGED